MAFLGRGDDPALRQAVPLHARSPAPRGRLGDLPGRPGRGERLGQGVLRAEAGGAARRAIRRWSGAARRSSTAGGAQACNSFTRFYLALLGQIGYDECPSVPPELVLIPSRLGFSLSAMSAWTRTIVVPLSIMSAFKPVRRLGAGAGIAELFREDLPRRPRGGPGGSSTWTNFFLGLDRLLKWADRWLPRSWREPGIRAAHRWMLEHFENSDGLGAIFPPMIYTVIALRVPGLRARLATGAVGLAAARRPADRGGRYGPGAALRLAGLGHGHRHDRAGRRPAARAPPGAAPRGPLAAEQGGPSARRLAGPPARGRASGWHFQYHNELYPDIDDTAMVLLALQRTALAESPEAKAATERGVNWLLAMQNRDGGWAAFDVDIDNQVLTKVPFADHNAMLDPSCADITARVLEMLGTLGYRGRSPGGRAGPGLSLEDAGAGGLLVRPLGRQLHLRHLAGLAGAQGDRLPDGPPGTPDGGRLARIGPAGRRRLGRDVPELRRPAADGPGEPTASQTAWAVLGLIAAGRAHGDGRPPRHRIPAGDAAARRLLGRGSVHRHRLPPRLLPEVPPVPRLLPADGPGALPGCGRHVAGGEARRSPAGSPPCPGRSTLIRAGGLPSDGSLKLAGLLSTGRGNPQASEIGSTGSRTRTHRPTLSWG